MPRPQQWADDQIAVQAREMRARKKRGCVLLVFMLVAAAAVAAWFFREQLGL